jgi:hypothetical protein
MMLAYELGDDITAALDFILFPCLSLLTARLSFVSCAGLGLFGHLDTPFLSNPCFPV